MGTICSLWTMIEIFSSLVNIGGKNAVVVVVREWWNSY